MQAEEAMNDLSTGAEGVHSDAITDLEDANLPPVPPVKRSVPGVPRVKQACEAAHLLPSKSLRLAGQALPLSAQLPERKPSREPPVIGHG
jgi:hypothetical protein